MSNLSPEMQAVVNKLPMSDDPDVIKRRIESLKKPVPHQLAKADRDKAKADKGETFRRQVWTRDKHHCRATGAPLVRSGTTDWKKLGEVDHALLRSTNPDRIYDVSNGILLQKALNRLRKVSCPEAPEFKMFDYTGPEDRGELQTFTWRDKTGKVTNVRVG